MGRPLLNSKVHKRTQETEINFMLWCIKQDVKKDQFKKFKL